jgi:DNA-binding phage protein
MALTRSFKDFIKSRVENDAEFRQALFQEAVQTLIEGDMDTAKSVLRDYINATIGFQALAEITGTPPKSLMRMFGPKGNPQARHLLGVIAALQTASGIHFEVHAVANAA